MRKYKSVRIGEVCSVTKGETGLASAIPGKYPLVTTGANRKTSNSYQFDAEAVCIPLVSSTGHGKKTLNYVHFEKGKFAVGTILAAVIPKRPNEISAEYLYLYLQYYKDKKIVPLMQGAANVSLSIKNIEKIEVDLPPINEQKVWLDIYRKFNVSFTYLQEELSMQSASLKLLRQSILQDAIEGQLTVEWRKKNPVKKGDPETDASALLDKIKQEKQKLIAQGKIKKDKPLPPIKPDEIPFKLPPGWLWTRLGEVCEGFQYGTSTRSVKNGKVPVLRMGNLQNGKIDWENLVFTNDETEIRQYRLKKGDLLFNRTNSRELVGKTCLFNIDRVSIFAGYLIRFSMLGGISDKYSNLVFSSIFHRKWCNLVKSDAIGQSNINATKLRDYLYPFPSISEQVTIVERMDKLLGLIDELEKEATTRQTLSEDLMQEVLKEAFEGGK